MSTQRDFAKEWKEAFTEYEHAKDAYSELSGAVLCATPQCITGSRTTPPPDLVKEALDAKNRLETAKERLLKIRVEWAKL